jgi:hypothetical protein
MPVRWMFRGFVQALNVVDVCDVGAHVLLPRRDVVLVEVLLGKRLLELFADALIDG